MQIDFVKALGISAIFAIAWAIYRDRNAKALTKAAKEAALEKFRQVTVTNEDERLQFDGATAKVLKFEETGVIWNPSSGTYTLAVWAANHCGNDFHVRVSADQVFVKQVPENMARGHLPSNARITAK
jgi:hypothetical protein